MRNAVCILLLLPWIAAGATGATDAAPAKRVVRGTVIDPVGDPVPQAPVRLVRLAEKTEPQVVATAVSDQNGMFRLETTSYGGFDLVVSLRGFHAVTTHFEMSAEEREKDVGTMQLKDIDCSTAMCGDIVVAWSQEVTVWGLVSTLDDGEPAGIGDATLEFRSADGDTLGHTIAMKTNRMGGYEVLLQHGLDYTIAVKAKGFCMARRPFFRLDPGPAVRFDFALATNCRGDVDVVGVYNWRAELDKELFDESSGPRPYYFEEDIARGNNHNPGRSLIIAFGTRRKWQDRVEYSSLPVKGHPGIHYPVTVRFDTYTVRADAAVLDRSTRVLTLQGNVLVEDGRGSPPTASGCVTLGLDSSDVGLGSCQASAPGSGPIRPSPMYLWQGARSVGLRCADKCNVRP